jgi:hypothetical protein
MRFRIKDTCFFLISMCPIVPIVVQNLCTVQFSKVEISTNVIHFSLHLTLSNII